jgi:hypothetical protein
MTRGLKNKPIKERVKMPNKKPELELKRNTLSVRWDDQAMKLLADESWKRRTNCSELIRVAVVEKFNREGVKTT